MDGSIAEGAHGRKEEKVSREGFLKKSLVGGNDSSPNQNLIAKVGGGYEQKQPHDVMLLFWLPDT